MWTESNKEWRETATSKIRAFCNFLLNGPCGTITGGNMSVEAEGDGKQTGSRHKDRFLMKRYWFWLDMVTSDTNELFNLVNWNITSEHFHLRSVSKSQNWTQASDILDIKQSCRLVGWALLEKGMRTFPVRLYQRHACCQEEFLPELVLLLCHGAARWGSW